MPRGAYLINASRGSVVVLAGPRRGHPQRAPRGRGRRRLSLGARDQLGRLRDRAPGAPQRDPDTAHRRIPTEEAQEAIGRRCRTR